MSGDWLLFLNNAVLGVLFVPTLMKRDAKVHLATAGIYTAMIAVGAVGYSLNGQWLPAVPTAIGAVLWAAMFIKSLR